MEGGQHSTLPSRSLALLPPPLTMAVGRGSTLGGSGARGGSSGKDDTLSGLGCGGSGGGGGVLGGLGYRRSGGWERRGSRLWY
jgi:hypothetical protein